MVPLLLIICTAIWFWYTVFSRHDLFDTLLPCQFWQGYVPSKLVITSFVRFVDISFSTLPRGAACRQWFVHFLTSLNSILYKYVIDSAIVNVLHGMYTAKYVAGHDISLYCKEQNEEELFLPFCIYFRSVISYVSWDASWLRLCLYDTDLSFLTVKSRNRCTDRCAETTHWSEDSIFGPLGV